MLFGLRLRCLTLAEERRNVSAARRPMWIERSLPTTAGRQRSTAGAWRPYGSESAATRGYQTRSGPGKRGDVQTLLAWATWSSQPAACS